MKRRSFIQLAAGAALATGVGPLGFTARAASKTIVYLTPGLDLPFWRYLSKGVESAARAKGYDFLALDSRNNPQTQLQNAQDSIAKGVAGIVISPTDSSTAPSVLELAKRAGIPVVDRRYRHQQRRLCLLHHLQQLRRRQGRRRRAGRGDEEEGLGKRLGRADHDLAGAQERSGSHPGLPRRRLSKAASRRRRRDCSRCSPIPPTRPSSSPRTC